MLHVQRGLGPCPVHHTECQKDVLRVEFKLFIAHRLTRDILSDTGFCSYHGSRATLANCLCTASQASTQQGGKTACQCGFDWGALLKGPRDPPGICRPHSGWLASVLGTPGLYIWQMCGVSLRAFDGTATGSFSSFLCQLTSVTSWSS